MTREIKYTPRGFSYVDVSLKEYSDEDVLHDLILQKEHDKQYYEAYSKYFLGEWNNEKN